MLTGKGWFIWQIGRCERGNAEAIAREAEKSGLSHVLIKIADGDHAYAFDYESKVDLARPVIEALQRRGILCFGWQYVRGDDPVGEANAAIVRSLELGVDGFVINAEEFYELPGKSAAAEEYMARLRRKLPNLPIALCSYRYPSYHPHLPWKEFLERCDYNMPLVYWESANNPGEQLARSVREFEALTPFRPIIPTGSAYKRGSWSVTPSQILEFLQTARMLNLQAANFWEWGFAKTYMPELWETVSFYSWNAEKPPEDIVVRYLAALNAHDPAEIASLYNENALLRGNKGVIQGRALIRDWYASFFSGMFQDATFSLVDSGEDQDSRRIHWSATSRSGEISAGEDYLILADGLIDYHIQFLIEK